MIGEWGSAAIVVAVAAAGISLIGAAAALWAAWVSHRMLKRQAEADKPTLDCRLTSLENGWMEIQLILENPTTSSWSGRHLRVLGPNGTVVGNWNDTHTQDGYGGFQLDVEKLAAVTATEAHLSIEVGPVGSSAPSYAGRARGDRGWGTAYLRPPTGARNLKMELLVESLGGMPRREKYRIVRDIPQPE